jgi:molybdenum cofactor synthesis domain-containing protein
MKASKTAAILIIGDEILSGRTQDSNVRTIALMLAEKGIAVSEVRVIPDVIETIVRSVRELAGFDYVFSTGGIGPTHDDKTAEAMAKAFDVVLERNPEAWALLVKQYGSEDQINEGRARMAMIPRGASLIANPVSGAPGFKIGNVHVMAGVPKIMEAMLEGVLPTLEGGAIIHSRSVGADVAESEMSRGLEEIENNHPGVSVGSYPKFRPGMKPSTVIVARGTDLPMVESAIEKVAILMREKGGIPGNAD